MVHPLGHYLIVVSQIESQIIIIIIQCSSNHVENKSLNSQIESQVIIIINFGLYDHHQIWIITQ